MFKMFTTFLHTELIFVFLTAIVVSRCENATSSPEYNSNNAVMFAKLSAVAYAEPEYLSKCIKNILPDDDFEVVEAIGRKCEKWFDYKECFVYTALSHRHRTILVGYRGTTNNWQITEEVFSRKSADNDWVLVQEDGRIHRYFNFAFNRLYDPCIRQSVKTLANNYKTYDVVVTGHSLGGALASLTSYALVREGVVATDRMTLYTFGMPRVGDKRYAFNHDKRVPNSWRIIHWSDIVPKVPPKMWGYYHHRTAVLYPMGMDTISEFKICSDNEDPECNGNKSSLQQHYSYFGINMGGYCKDNLKYKRGTNEPKFPEDHCEVITLKDAGEILDTEIKNATESVCDFEKKDACDWIKSPGSTFSFKRHKGATDSAGKTGPTSDSSNSISGYYIYAEASGNEGQLTKLRSPNFFAGTYCLEFFYHMFGANMGELKLVMNSSKTSRKTIFKASGDHGRDWKEVRRSIDVASQKDIVIYFEFEATIGKGYNSDIAIDNIRITQKKCYKTTS